MPVSTGPTQLSLQEALNHMMGAEGFKRLAVGTHVAGSGSHATVQEFLALKAKNGSATYGPACVASVGSIPSEDDTILEGDIDIVKLTTVVVKTGVMYAYYRLL